MSRSSRHPDGHRPLSGAIIDATRALQQRGAVIGIVLCVIDRESGGSSNLSNENLVLRFAFTMSELLAAVRHGDAGS